MGILPKPSNVDTASRAIHATQRSDGSGETPEPAGGTPTLPGNEQDRPRTAQSFCVPRADLAAQGYDLSLNRYKEVVHAEVAHKAPGEILQSLARLETEIQQGIRELEGMIS